MSLAAPAQDLTEKRTQPRNRLLLNAVLVWGGHAFTPDCIIRNMTAKGAAVRLTYPLQLPETLVLLELKSGRAHEARVVWRRGEFVGLALGGTRDVSGATGDPLRQLWVDRQPRTR